MSAMADHNRKLLAAINGDGGFTRYTDCPLCESAEGACSLCGNTGTLLLRAPFMAARIDGADLLLCETARAKAGTSGWKSFGYTVWTEYPGAPRTPGRYVAEGTSIEDARANAAAALVARSEGGAL